jgi:hypothetical protein
MKKSVIALALAAAMPVATQADVFFYGSVSAEHTLGSNLVPVTEAKLSATASKVLANGMTATVDFSVLDADTQGTVGLSGDFGEVKAGTAAKILEDVADSAPNDAETKDDEDADLNGVAYTGSFAGLKVNAAKGQFDEDERDDVFRVDVDGYTDYDNKTSVEYSTYGASYNFNGLTVTGQNTKEGSAASTTEVTASYAFGDLTVSSSKSTGDDAVVKGAYSTIRGDLAVMVSADSADEWDLEATYTMGDLAVTAKDDEEAGGAKVSAKYTSGDLSLEVDSDSKVTVAYNMGDADLSMTRDDDDTKVKYVVAF